MKTGDKVKIKGVAEDGGDLRGEVLDANFLGIGVGILVKCTGKVSKEYWYDDTHNPEAMFSENDLEVIYDEDTD